MNIFSGILIEDESYMSQLGQFYDNNQPRVLSCLPKIAAELAYFCGFASMLRIIQTYGGRKLYLAANVEDLNAKLGLNLSEHQYTTLLDNTDARGFLDIPSMWGIFLAVRRAAIIEAVGEGTSNHEIIQRFGLTERGLRKYRKSELLQ